ncbi:DUF7518 family protein [Halorussus halophilus]|uniref:DUF7518 family protein n=1 Tax=Halorussus halophilus TaxID=2650975 RepID=UPI001300DD1D|nr:hypothetical protein [Halorussus halophilus]
MTDESERVEELEAQVERLEATVKGLTEELVEVNDRLETLEGDDSTLGTETTTESRPERKSDAESPARDEETKSTQSKEEDETGDDSGLGDDIIVA